MKKFISLIIAMLLAFGCVCMVNAQETKPVAKLELSKAEPLVGDTITVSFVIDNNKSEGFMGADAAVFYNKDVLQYDAEYGIQMNPELADLGMDKIFSKAENSIVRGTVAITPTAYNGEIVKVGNKIKVWSVQFKVIAEGDTKLRFALEGETAEYTESLPEGVMVFLDGLSKSSEILMENNTVIVGKGKPSVMITEITGISEVKVPVGTSAEEVLKKLPSEVEVKLDNGETGKVKMSWMSGSLISGYDGNTPGEYYFTGNIADSGEYVNYRNLFSMVKIIVGEGPENKENTEDTPKTQIIMVIDSNKPVVNGKETEIDVPAKIMENRTFTPARFVAEALGAKVEWNEETRTVTITRGERIIKLTINSNIALIDGKETEIDVPAKIVDNRTLTPARFVAEALGAKVDWKEETRTVTITE